MSNLTQDIRYTVQSLLRQPGFAMVIVCSLALGIGARRAAKVDPSVALRYE